MRIEPFARWMRDLMDEPWAFWFPEAPYPMERRLGGIRSIGHAWYVWEGDTAAFRETLRRSEERIMRLLDERAPRHGFDPDKLVALGFSQGGYFTGSLALRYAERFRGLAVAAARIRPGYADRPIETIPRIPILFIHGRNDEVVSASDARESAEELRAQGFPVTWAEVEGEHIWNGAMSEALRSWVRTIL